MVIMNQRGIFTRLVSKLEYREGERETDAVCVCGRGRERDREREREERGRGREKSKRVKEGKQTAPRRNFSKKVKVLASKLFSH